MEDHSLSRRYLIISLVSIILGSMFIAQGYEGTLGPISLSAALLFALFALLALLCSGNTNTKS